MYGNPDWKAVPVFLDVMMAVTVYALALAILINSTTSHLISLYGYLASTVLVGLSYLVNSQIIDQVIKAGFFNTFLPPNFLLLLYNYSDVKVVANIRTNLQLNYELGNCLKTQPLIRSNLLESHQVLISWTKV